MLSETNQVAPVEYKSSSVYRLPLCTKGGETTDIILNLRDKAQIRCATIISENKIVPKWSRGAHYTVLQSVPRDQIHNHVQKVKTNKKGR